MTVIDYMKAIFKFYTEDSFNFKTAVARVKMLASGL